MQFDALSLECTDGVAEVRLSERAWTSQIRSSALADLDAAIRHIRDDVSIRAVLVTSEGSAFADGSLDVWPADHSSQPPFRCLETSPLPAIACIEGDATGAGLELALACDLRVGSRAARFAAAIDGGASPAGGGQRLARLVGRTKAMEMLLMGTVVGADEAAGCGLLNQVVEPGKARAAGQLIASKIAERGPLAVAYAKEAIARGLEMPLDEALRHETDLTIILQTTNDRAEGVRAFLEKRLPKFDGT